MVEGAGRGGEGEDVVEMIGLLVFLVFWLLFLLLFLVSMLSLVVGVHVYVYDTCKFEIPWSMIKRCLMNASKLFLSPVTF